MTTRPPKRSAVDPVPGPVVQPGLSVSPPVAGRPGTPSSPPLAPWPREAAGSLNPVTGALTSEHVRAPGRGRAAGESTCITASHAEISPAAGTRTPAGEGRSRAAGASPDGSRTFTITLPAGMELLNANDRDIHWARRKRITRELRQTTGWKARIQHIPAMQRAYVLGVYEPPDRRRRDPANLYPSFKACVDGLVDAGVLPDDDAAHLDGPDMRLGEVCRQGRLVLHLTEVAS